MARIRYLKPEFFDDEDLCSLKPLARLLFAGLWCWADREGRLRDSPVRLKKNILGYDNCNLDDLLNELAASGFILRYSGSDGYPYIQIVHFLKHQRPHVKEVPSTYPAPTQIGALHLLDPPGMGNGEGNGEGDGQQERDVAAAIVFSAVENLLGSLTKPVIDAINAELDDDTSVEWITAACEEAALANVRRWNYVAAILRNWRQHGFRSANGRASAGGRNGRDDAGADRKKQTDAAARGGKW